MDEFTSSNPEQGFWLNFAPEASEGVHAFCGPNEIEGGNCTNCSKPLLRLLSLDASDSRLNLDSSQKTAIHLLYCRTCSIPFGVFSYRILHNGSVEMLNVPSEYEYAFGPSGPYDGYTGHFPLKKIGLRPLIEDEHRRQVDARLNDDIAREVQAVQKHQVGGLPVITNPEEFVCPACSKRAPFLAVVYDNASGNPPREGQVPSYENFTDNPGTQMESHLCCGCSIISVYH